MTTSSFLVDTNVVSELVRRSPDPGVIAFLEGAAALSISVIAVHELCYGVEAMSDPIRRARLADFLFSVRERFKSRTLPVNADVAETAARFRAREKIAGRILTVSDALIAATSRCHGLVLATRNVKDFAHLSIPLLDPFELA